MTYEDLKRKYPTNAEGSPWHALSDDELGTDLRFAAHLRVLGETTQESAGGRVIERWIAHELRARAQRQPRPNGRRSSG